MAENKDNSRQQLPRGAHLLYVVMIALVFAVFAVVFLFFPRTRYSELEKRDLATFPDYREYAGRPSALTADISQWFSDSEPFRDNFMTLSMGIRDALSLNFGDDEEVVSFKPSTSPTETTQTGVVQETEDLTAQGNPNADDIAKIANAGIIIVGKGANVRALMAFGASPQGASPYVDMVNAYTAAFPNATVYAMPIPSSTEFYLPDKAAKSSKPQKPVLDYIRDNISPKAKFVDIYPYLAAHTMEDIYLRTDHHWAPLGAFYATKALARTAGVPFKDLTAYERKVARNFVGSMYGYSKDIAVKNAPEDFVYYIPKGLNYKTTYITYSLNENHKVIGESKPHEGPFFHPTKDGGSTAYNTFMGGDQHLVKVNTGTPGNRKVMIIKDSFGNAIPGYLFYSFSEVHVVDFRFFSKDLKKYVKDNDITDIVLAFNVFNACTGSAMKRLDNILNQGDNTRVETNTPKAESTAAKKENAPSDRSKSKNETPATTHKSKSATEVHKEEPKEKPVEKPAPVESPAPQSE